jgi:hypothetical protein
MLLWRPPGAAQTTVASRTGSAGGRPTGDLSVTSHLRGFAPPTPAKTQGEARARATADRGLGLDHCDPAQAQLRALLAPGMFNGSQEMPDTELEGLASVRSWWFWFDGHSGLGEEAGDEVGLPLACA